MAIQFIEAQRSAVANLQVFGQLDVAGDILIAVCGEEVSAGNITGAASTNNDVWTAVPQQSSGHIGRAFWAIAKGGASLNTVSFNVSGTPSGFGQISIAKYRGLTGGFDSSNSGVGDTTTPVSVTTSHAQALIIGGFDTGYVVFASDGTYTIRTDTTTGNVRTAIVDLMVSSIGTYAPNISSPTGLVERFTMAFYVTPVSGGEPNSLMLTGCGT